MWEDKIFDTKEELEKWLERNAHRIQYYEIYINNAYGISYRPLRIIA